MLVSASRVCEFTDSKYRNKNENDLLCHHKENVTNCGKSGKAILAGHSNSSCQPNELIE